MTENSDFDAVSKVDKDKSRDDGIFVDDGMLDVGFRDYYVVSRNVASVEKDARKAGDLRGDVSRDEEFNLDNNVSSKNKYDASSLLGRVFDLDSIIASFNVEVLNEHDFADSDSEGGDLEESVSGIEAGGLGAGDEKLNERTEIKDPYEAGGNRDLYDSRKYDEGDDSELDYEALMKGKGVESFFETPEEVRRGGRSMLEIVGFVDVEAEKKRKAKREGNFI